VFELLDVLDDVVEVVGVTEVVGELAAVVGVGVLNTVDVVVVALVCGTAACTVAFSKIALKVALAWLRAAWSGCDAALGASVEVVDRVAGAAVLALTTAFRAADVTAAEACVCTPCAGTVGFCSGSAKETGVTPLKLTICEVRSETWAASNCVCTGLVTVVPFSTCDSCFWYETSSFCSVDNSALLGAALYEMLGVEVMAFIMARP